MPAKAAQISKQPSRQSKQTFETPYGRKPLWKERMRTVLPGRRKFSPLPFSPLPQPFLLLFTLFPCFQPNKRESSICGTGLFLFNSSCAHSPQTGLVEFAQSAKVVSQARNKTMVIFALLKRLALEGTSNYL